MHGIYTTYSQHMIKLIHTSRTSQNNADVNQPCSSWLEERDTAHPIRRKCWKVCHQSRPVPFDFDPIVLREPHPAQPCLPASVQTAAKAHCCSEIAECKGTRLCEVSHTLDDINVCMLRPLARCVFWPSPHDNLAHFVQNTVGFFKVPAFRPANTVRQTSLGQFKQRVPATRSSRAILAGHLPSRSTPGSAYSIPELRRAPLWSRCLGPRPAAHWTGKKFCPWTLRWSSCSAHIPGIYNVNQCIYKLYTMNIKSPLEQWGLSQGMAVSTLEYELCHQ